MVAAAPDVRAHLGPGQEFWYRPRQLLVAPADLSRVMARLVATGYSVGVGAPFAGVERVLFAADVNVKLVVDDLRDPTNWSPAPPPAVQPHHVVFGYPNVMGSPGGGPEVARAQAGPTPGNAGAGVLVGICDTGIWALAGQHHVSWFEGGYTAGPADLDPLSDGGGSLALQAGHGTFVAGVLRRAAPAVHFDPTVALSPSGVGDEESVCAALAALSDAVSFINLSLGCYTQDDQPPMPLANAIAERPMDTVVVAAAGNANATRPTWPAALGGVVAVAALGTNRLGVAAPATYSNHGPWVDLCAPGTWAGPYVIGRLEPPDDPSLEFVGWARWQGTSFATPYVVGRMATLVTATGATPTEAAAILQAGPVPFPGFGAAVG
jgi:hypothetical protein